MKSLFRWLLQSSTGLWILAVACALIGLRFSIWGFHFLSKGWSSKRWPATEGKILTSILHEVGSGRGMSYKAEIVYAYQVDGREHTATKIFWGDKSFLTTSESHLQERLTDDYREGQSVQIYYNPGRPEEAVLEPGAKFRMYVTFMAGILFLFAAVFLGSMAISR